jgi:hypothetical protein
MPMLESEMEHFPSHELVLKGRQQSFVGVGRFDLLFTDAYQTNVLMELKAVTAKYENATQLAKYKEALAAKGERNILMWLVAPSIPASVREFLDRIGIEYSEIHEVEFRRVAQRHDIVIASPNQQPILDPPPRPVPSTVRSDSVPTARNFQHALEQEFANATRHGELSVKIRAGDLHKTVGGYPGNHRMPTCCSVMRQVMVAGDIIVAEPERGAGASLTILYKLPRSGG